MSDEVLDESYDRLRDTGPEWGESKLSNHGPMVVEVLVRRGHADLANNWLTRYLDRLDALPSPTGPITDDNWRAALGDGDRVHDWNRYFERQLAEQPWPAALATWWERLLPEIAAGTTHGVIRVGHVVRTLLAGDQSEPVLAELAHGLAFWAARAQSVPAGAPPHGVLDAAAALDGLPRISDQTGSVVHRFGQLAALPGWAPALGALRGAQPEEVPERLAELVDAATVHYLGHGQSSPVLLVHAATAPNAVLHTLPALPRRLWTSSLTAAWTAAGAIVSTFAPARPVNVPIGDHTVDELLDRAVANGDEHVIKFADTAAEAYQRTGDQRTIAAALRAAELID